VAIISKVGTGLVLGVLSSVSFSGPTYSNSKDVSSPVHNQTTGTLGERESPAYDLHQGSPPEGQAVDYENALWY